MHLYFEPPRIIHKYIRVVLRPADKSVLGFKAFKVILNPEPKPVGVKSSHLGMM